MAVKVLITDDSSFVRMLLKKILVANGYEVVGEADNGVEAINLYKELSPDLVTMDITMPQMDGIIVLKTILEMNPEAKIIMCSADSNQAQIMNAMKAGAKEFITKPFEAKHVINTLNKVMMPIS